LSDVPTYGSVRYAQVYPDIDIVYHARDGQLEYDFVVAPGGDPQTIRLGFEGATSVEIDSQGALVLHTPGGDIRKPQPLVYQDDGSTAT
jgi:hypothetical protein